MNIFKKVILFFSIFFIISLTACTIDFNNGITTISDTSTTTISSDSTTTSSGENITTSDDTVTIATVIDGTVGDTYTTQGQVVGVSSKGFLLYDENDFIYVYFGVEPSVDEGDYVSVTGSTSLYGSKVQFTSDSVITFISNGSVAYDDATVISSGSALDNAIAEFQVGDYIQITGVLSVSGNYFNVAVEGSNYTVSIQFDSSILDLSDYYGETVTFNAYALYLVSSYLNVLPTEIIIDESDITSINDVITGTVGDSYITQGTVYGITATGFLLYDQTGYIYVYLGATPVINVGDNVTVAGMTTEYGGGVQFGSGTTYVYTSAGNVNAVAATVLETAIEQDTYINNFTVGDYIELSGTLSVSGNYYNINIASETYTGSLQFNPNTLALLSYAGEEITIEGYVLYLSGSVYLNVLVTNVSLAQSYDTIAAAKNGTTGETYTVPGQVIGVTSQGFLISDGTDSIYTFLNETPSLVVGDNVVVTGVTAFYSGTVQFTTGASYTWLSNTDVTYPDPIDLTNVSNLDAYIPSFVVGDYIEVKGVLTISGSYYNVIFNSSSYTGSLKFDATLIDLDSYENQEITIRGYVLYLSSGTYFTILPTVINPEVIESNPISNALNGTVGDSYTVKGKVVGITAKGYLLYDGIDYIYVYLNEAPSVLVGDVLLVTGTTTSYNNTIQFASGTTSTYCSHEDVVDPYALELSTATEQNTYIPTFNVGDYVEFSGVLTVSGNYYNVDIASETYTGSLQFDSSSLNLSLYNGENIQVSGYVLNISGSVYFNIIVKEVEVITSTSNTMDLYILEVNDLHGHIEQDEDGANGISNLSYLINVIRNTNPLDDVVLIANGDMFQGTGISNMTEGLAVLEAMNLMDFDAMGIGNHEFDWELTTILQYFDGDETNGEANFPLLNANIYKISDDSLLTIIDGNIFQYTIVTREGIDIGIISYIGDVYGSIAYYVSDEYYFDTNFASSVSVIATALKNNGVDIIVVNIHDGDASSIVNFTVNQQLAALTDTNGDYLVDVILNGHTHSFQTGSISRSNGAPCVVIQSGGNNKALGEIVLTIDLDTMEVITTAYQLLYVVDAGTSYDADVEAIVDYYQSLIESEPLVTAGETVSRTSDLQDWVGNVMIAATGADIAISNTGGIRSTAGIIAGDEITVPDLYEISPFDNTIILMELDYATIQSLISNSVLFYQLAPSVTLTSGETYTVAIISYVYGWYELDGVRDEDVDFDTGVIVRDLLIEDLTIKGENSELFNPISDPSADIGIFISVD